MSKTMGIIDDWLAASEPTPVHDSTERILLVVVDKDYFSFEDTVGLDEWEEDWLWEEFDANRDLYIDKGYGAYKFSVSQWIPDHDEYGKQDGGNMESTLIEYLTLGELESQ